MFFSNLLARRGQAPRAVRKPSSVVVRAASPVVEALESRRLLSTYTYYVPAGTSLITLRPDVGNSGVVKVYLGGDFSSPVHTFTDPDGTDVIQASGSAVRCQDQVPAIDAPTGGIQFNSGSSSTLEIDAGVDDTDIEVRSYSGGVGTVDVYDAGTLTDGQVIYGAGVSTLDVRPNDAGGATVNAPALSAAIHLVINTGAGTDDTVNLGNGLEGNTVTDADIITGAGGDVVNVAGDADDSQTTATIDFGDGTGSGDNTLNVLSYCVATIAQLAGASHTVALDNLNISAQGTAIIGDAADVGAVQVDGGSLLGAQLIVNAASSIGTLNVDHLGVADVEAPTTIDSLTGAGTVEFTGTSNPSAITTADQTGNVIVDYGASVTVGGGSPAAAASTFNLLSVAGDLYLASPVTVTELDQSNGLVQLDQADNWTTNPMVNEIDTISITGGLLDLDGQDLLTTTGTATLRSYLASAYDGGGTNAWQGTTGITSSLVSDPAYQYGIGYAVSGHANIVPTIPSGKTLLRPTMFGHTSLDGTANNSDISALIAAGYYNDGTGGHTWAGGDWNYDGYVNSTDISNLVAAGTYNDTPPLDYPG